MTPVLEKSHGCSGLQKAAVQRACGFCQAPAHLPNLMHASDAIDWLPVSVLTNSIQNGDEVLGRRRRQTAITNAFKSSLVSGRVLVLRKQGLHQRKPRTTER